MNEKSLDTGSFYHGTKGDLNLGDLLEPRFSSNYGEQKKENFIFSFVGTIGIILLRIIASRFINYKFEIVYVKRDEGMEENR
ncbi:NAD(+)--rifampin ADP-ribosyltransferase [Heyndrickxia ginsengihumi]|uniref:NAD(+)--rifampin ADP-ribosyltransferase n=1 Tax=Heyndrickxia ginsengihumi TaxID=363870 RepID=UPI00126A40CE|nr:NAD(+)--rifampin ADP-ribosyltransferase [Heyndrickxia ginsengihumi]